MADPSSSIVLTDPAALTRALKARAHGLGFDLCGVAPAGRPKHAAEFVQWIADGRHAGMAYMARDVERRLDLDTVLPQARYCVAVGMNYYTADAPDGPDADTAWFARYARGDDYHEVLRRRLRELGRYLTAVAGAPIRWRAVVDTAPVLERDIAQRAGLGFFGKSSMLISPKIGTYFVIAVMLTDANLVPDEPAVGTCGRCTRCMDACPTSAIVAPHIVDARLCLSYHTIESRDPIPDSIAARMGNRVFGCDVCQEVCPFNQRRAKPTREAAFLPRPSVNATLRELLCLTDEGFREAFRGSAVRRAQRTGLVRNAEAAARQGRS